MSKIKVSVIIPVYNAEKYLKQCIDSVTAQSLREIEIICVDAGSSDGSASILMECAKRDSRIRVISRERLDAGAARNVGMDLAQGEYLSFLDADDIFDEYMLEKCYKQAAGCGADIIVFRARQLDMCTGKVSDMPWSLRMAYCPRSLTFSPMEMRKYLFNCFQNWAWNKLFHAEFVANNGIRFQSVARTNDMAFTCHALAKAQVITLLPETLMTYRVGTGTSLQSTIACAPTACWEAHVETKRRLEQDGVYEQYRQSFMNTALSGILHNLSCIHDVHAYRELYGLLQSCGEQEFGFGKEPRSYYLNRDNYDKYNLIISGAEPIVTDESGEESGLLRALKKCTKKLIESDIAYMMHAKLIRIGVIKY